MFHLRNHYATVLKTYKLGRSHVSQKRYFYCCPRHGDLEGTLLLSFESHTMTLKDAFVTLLQHLYQQHYKYQQQQIKHKEKSDSNVSQIALV